MSDFLSHAQKVKTELDQVSPAFCLAKWLQVTVHLHTGKTHSCHHPRATFIPVSEIKKSPSALHLSESKKAEQAALLKGEQHPQCNYCWKVENETSNVMSDRVLKSASDWAYPYLPSVLNTKEMPKNPSYLELDVGNTCNLRCVYCSPEYSTKWVEDIQRNGPYRVPDKNMNWFSMYPTEMVTELQSFDAVPYEEAFAKWWPVVRPHLKVFRLTGGEPLLNKITWDILQSLIDEPEPDMEICINTNLVVPSMLIDRLINTLNILQTRVKRITIFTSAEATGEHQEYIRDGLNWTEFTRNVDKVLTQVPLARVTFMTTISTLSVFTWVNFVTYVMNLRTLYRSPRIGLSVNYLRHPELLSLSSLNQSGRDYFRSGLEISSSLPNLLNHEKAQMTQVSELIAGSPSESDENLGRGLTVYLSELQKRRGLRPWREVFPQLEAFLLKK